MNKYGARKTEVDGIVFDSKKEATRWCELRLLERAGEISNLSRQTVFGLIPAQRDEKGKVIEKAVKYIADFTYFEKNGEFVVEDTKGVRTKEYIIKRKMLLYFHGLRIKEV